MATWMTNTDTLGFVLADRFDDPIISKLSLLTPGKRHWYYISASS